MYYDLHIHSALSPCADDDMTPANIAGFAKLAGAELIAVSDHNSARNLQAVQKACDYYDIRLLPAIEANTAEEIHLLCYFPTIEAALEMGSQIYESLPDIAVDSSVWGNQLIIDENDAVIGTVEKLLTLASGMGIYEMGETVKRLGGVAVPAHADRDSYSLLTVMGFLPEDLGFEMIELTQAHKYQMYCSTKRLPPGLEILTSSDAHSLQQLIRDPLPTLEESHRLFRMIDANRKSVK